MVCTSIGVNDNFCTIDVIWCHHKWRHTFWLHLLSLASQYLRTCRVDRLAHILGILLMNSCNTDISFSNYYHLQSVRFELDWYYFRCCFGFGEKYKSAAKRPTGLQVTVRSRLSLTNSRQLATNAPEKLTAGRPFWYPYRMLEIWCTPTPIAKDKNSTQN